MMQNNNNKGAFMSLPFIAGIAAGVIGVLAWNKKDELLKMASDEMQKGKDLLSSAYEKSKSVEKETSKKQSKSSGVTKAKRSTRAKNQQL